MSAYPPEPTDVACWGRPAPFDVLIEGLRGRRRQRALQDAVGMCAECPLRAACFRENAGEDWVKPIRRVLKVRAA